MSDAIVKLQQDHPY